MCDIIYIKNRRQYMQFFKFEGTEVTLYKDREFPFEDKWEFMLEDGLCYSSAINKNWYICNMPSEADSFGTAVIQRFEYSYEDYDCDLKNSLGAHYLCRKGKQSLSNRDIKKILTIIFDLNINFKLNIIVK